MISIDFIKQCFDYEKEWPKSHLNTIISVFDIIKTSAGLFCLFYILYIWKYWDKYFSELNKIIVQNSENPVT